MTQQDVFSKVQEILRPFVKDPAILAAATPETSILGDLDVNSARLVDIVLEMEDAFGIAIGDEDADRVQTLGDAVSLVMNARA